MAWLTDEEFEFKEDVKDKAITARSSHSTKGHCGKGGRMKTAADFMSKKELDKLNGECKTYKLGEAMSWNTFIDMPDDLKVMYIKKLRKLFNVPDEALASAMGVDISEFNKCLAKIKLRPLPENRDWYDTEGHGRFLTWWIIREEV